MRILFLGDIVGSPGRKAAQELVPKITNREKIDFVVANAENAAGGSGITKEIAKELFSYGIDVITSGDHVWKKREIFEYLDEESKLLRPANYPKGSPGVGYGVYPAGKYKVGIINLVGRVFMEAVECPFKVSREIIDVMRKETPIILIDMHAEATSEKIALVWYLDGMVSAVLGTHTHVQTADERIYPKGTAFLCDLGMVGPHDSVIGRKVEQIISRFITALPTKFEMADGNVRLNGAIITVDEKTGRATEIKRVSEGVIV